MAGRIAKGNHEVGGGLVIMNKTKIEWCDYTINPVKGLCPMACPYCYARRLYKRFKWNPEIRFEDDAFYGLAQLDINSCYSKNPAKVFVGSTIELFHDSIPEGWLKTIFEYVRLYYHNTYIFLTKQPQNLIKYSPFPDNVWVGVTAPLPEDMRRAFKHLHYDVKAPVKFVSFEPMQGMIIPFREDWFTASGVNWSIIGAQTPCSKKTFPKWYWVEELINACDKAGVPVFLKNNLGLPKYNWEGGMPFYKKHPSGTMELRQEMPESKGGGNNDHNKRRG